MTDPLATLAAPAPFLTPSPSMEIKNKVIVITGASSGIGAAAAEAFAKKGARVVLAARNAAGLNALADKINAAGAGSAWACPTDMTQRHEVENLARVTFERFGRLDIFIHNAGISHKNGTLMELDESEVRRVMETNFMGGIYSTWAAVPYLEKSGGGQLIFVTSIIGKVGVPRNSIYCASKFALQGLAESIRRELVTKKIRVISICPPGVDTPFFKNNDRALVRKYRLHPVEKIARMIVRASEKNKREVLLTMDAKLLHFLNCFFPTLMDWAVVRFKKR